MERHSLDPQTPDTRSTLVSEWGEAKFNSCAIHANKNGRRNGGKQQCITNEDLRRAVILCCHPNEANSAGE